ncbi:MAG TPA: HD domain-containing protein [Polyangiaceae bacterium]|jgi:hypothetical protein|nr:MAG: hypothetical protein BWY17_02800 [Deltaproteobacteria bacterium ADurb.Bin207]HNS95805.1 HD domain-containing protein [Polyangiaceae bacterium]HNZ24634.1 HD domain-containing protein [Polyangiaceae bacterium]HOD23234.1 HD domain-containing protein [Polyangiaceae bacterium]HOH02652.1 HD domain-containing protein [Polyangiaceae bacterium]
MILSAKIVPLLRKHGPDPHDGRMQEPFEQRVKRWLVAYADSFRELDALHPMLEFKLGHSARVAAYARLVAQASGWSAEETGLGESAGWLHDVGRFTQWVEYGTYQDALSIDHAQRSREVVQGSSWLETLPDAHQRRLLDAIGHHNKRELPASIDQDSLPLCHLVRDADKLDILDLTHRMLMDGTLQEAQPQLSGEPYVSDELIEEIQETGRGSYAKMRTLMDFVVVSVAWAWDFQFAATARLVLEQEMMAKLEPYLPSTERVGQLLRQARVQLEKSSAGVRLFESERKVLGEPIG